MTSKYYGLLFNFSNVVIFVIKTLDVVFIRHPLIFESAKITKIVVNFC
jgi:hypothetical protein